MRRAVHRRVRALTIMTGAAVIGLSSIALGAVPIGGATYRGHSKAKFIKSSDNSERLSVAKNRKSIQQYSLAVPAKCTNGHRYDLFFNSAGEKPIPVKKNGTFTRSRTETGELTGETGAGHYTVSIRGRFVTARKATITFKESWTNGGAGGVVGPGATTCSGSTSFTVTTSKR